MNDPTPTGRALSAACSLVLPGSGQFYQGYAKAALLYIAVAATCWAAVGALFYFIPALPAWIAIFGLIGHVIAAIDAGRKRPLRVPPDDEQPRLP